MSTRRARVQYGKASKRVNSRLTPVIASAIPEDEVVNVEPAEPQARPPATKTRNRTSTKKEATEDVKHDQKRDNARGSRSPTRAHSSKVSQHTSTRKRKRDPSPASSELTDAVEDSAPIPKASRRAASDVSPTKKPNFAPDGATATKIPRTPSRPSTPNEVVTHTPKLTRDLSDLFISPHRQTNSVTGSPSKPGHLKRMLSKAKTDSVLEPPQTLAASSELFPSKSMITPSSSPQKKEFVLPSVAAPSFERHPLAKDRTPSPPRRVPTPPPVPRSPQKTGRTYARSRSYLVEIPRDTVSMDVDGVKFGSVSTKKGIPANGEDEELHRESMNDLRSRWGLHDSEQDPTLNTPINDLNSIGEMRSKGETRRFLDEVGYLLDGLDSSTGKVNTAAKRASAIEIVAKLGNSEFFRRATAADFVARAWSALRSAGAGSSDDKILDAALVAFASIVTKDPRQAAELSRTDDFISFLAMSVGVGQEDDVLIPPPLEQETIWARKQGLSRVDRTSLIGLRAAIENGCSVPGTETPSSRLLASQSLVRAMELGKALNSNAYDAVVNSLITELFLIPKLRSGSPSNEISNHDWRHIRNCLRVVESFSARQANSRTSEPNEDQETLLSLLAQYISLWPSQLVATEDSSGLDSTIDTTLRYIVTISHDNIPISDTLASSPNLLHNLLRLFVLWYRSYFEGLGSHSEPISKDQENEDDEDDRSAALERVSLSLGLLTQLVKQSNVAKSTIRSIRLSPSCPASGRCAEECRCSKRISGICVLTNVFNKSDEGLSATAEAQAHFLRGNIGVLLGLLCLHDSSNRTEVLSQLKPVEGADEAKLHGLIDVIRDFSTLLSDVVGAVGGQERSPDGSEAQSATDPLVSKAQAEGMDEGVQLAHKVIRGLESLL